MENKKSRVLTGSRTTGMPHLGNYFGAYKPAIDLQEKYELFLFLADFHALNETNSAAQNQANSYEMIATYLACGLDLKRSLLYAQSAVPEVNELAWVLSCVTPYGFMCRAHSFKDAQAKGNDVNMGVFNYPILMAADILLYDGNLVPVGQDQKQHVEMARDMAQRFNHRYGEVFTLPDPIITDGVALVPGTDGEKMSKSKNNTIHLFADEKTWKKQVANIVTDTKGLADPKDPETCNIFGIYGLLASSEESAEMAAKYRAGGYGYGHAKAALLDKIKAKFGPMSETYFDLIKRPADLHDLLLTGSRKAREIAVTKLVQVQRAVGLIGRPF